MKKILLLLILLVTMIFSSCKKKVEEISVEKVTTDAEHTDTEHTDTGHADAEHADAEHADMESNEKLQMENVVFVCGAVNDPGVYYLKPGSLKKDALDMAGGFTEDAADWYVNLAEEVKSGERIYFPNRDEVDKNDLSGLKNSEPSSAEDKKHLININTAGEKELVSLPGIGSSRAQAIIKYRETHGAFVDKADICKVEGIKDGLYSKIKDYITIN